MDNLDSELAFSYFILNSVSIYVSFMVFLFFLGSIYAHCHISVYKALYVGLLKDAIVTNVLMEIKHKV